MNIMPYARLPESNTLDVKPFTAHVDQSKLDHFRRLLSLSPVGPVVFENNRSDRRYGIDRDWLLHAKQVWLDDFDWRKHEDRINCFPSFEANVEDEKGNTLKAHFLALFSEKSDATPIAFLHGWPGSNLEFLDILDLVRKRYAPEDLPYHIIVPSLPGYGYSSGPPTDADFGIGDAATTISRLMHGLGFGSGYLVQGGDLGSFVSRYLALNDDACMGMHVNMMALPPLEELQKIETDADKEVLARAAEFVDTSLAFQLVQGSRTATVGFALSASPLALLSWVGEKLLAWSDEDPSLDKILESVTLWWLTDTMPRCLYHSRELGNIDDEPRIARNSAFTRLEQVTSPYIGKPCGYSLFAHEIIPVPKHWATKTCNLVSYNEHGSGGHFAAVEKPAELLSDVEEYVRRVRDSSS